ncbi:MAG TPA: glycosyltransferase [Pirellulales bacterium]|nr:glycosyltransferase [Pirellulales bacterium]
MYAPWFVVWLVIAALACVQFAVLTWWLWENRRFARARLRKAWPREAEPRVALFAPCKGIDVGLEENLRPLLEQNYSNYTLTFIVESADDAACAVLQHLIADHPHVDARLTVAGVADDTGQKVHNLRAATSNLADDVQVLAFVDSDARPRRDWLRRLVSRLPHPGVGAVTGYRWFRPTRPTAAHLLLYGINSSVAASFGPGGHYLIWGGSWAIRRDVFDALQLREAWQRTLSDDLVATRVVHGAGLRIEFEPACMVSSPVDGDWRQALEFVRRQYVIARAYAWRWWLLALVGGSLPVLALWGGLAALAIGLWQHAEWTWLPAAICPAYYATTLVRGYQRWMLGRTYVADQPPLMQRIAWLDIWTGPLVSLINWLAILSSLVGNHLRWRGIDYHLARGGTVVALARRCQPAATPTAGAKPRTDETVRPVQRRKQHVAV